MSLKQRCRFVLVWVCVFIFWGGWGLEVKFRSRRFEATNLCIGETFERVIWPFSATHGIHNRTFCGSAIDRDSKTVTNPSFYL